MLIICSKEHEQELRQQWGLAARMSKWLGREERSRGASTAPQPSAAWGMGDTMMDVGSIHDQVYARSDTSA